MNVLSFVCRSVGHEPIETLRNRVELLWQRAEREAWGSDPECWPSYACRTLNRLQAQIAHLEGPDAA